MGTANTEALPDTLADIQAAFAIPTLAGHDAFLAGISVSR